MISFAFKNIDGQCYMRYGNPEPRLIVNNAKIIEKKYDGNKVYVVGRGRSKVLIPGLYNLTSMLHKEKLLDEKIIFSNTSPTVPLPMTFGGLLSRWLKIDFLGVPLLVKGAKQSYKNVIKLVNHTKQASKEDKSEVIILDNKEFKKK
ncbi:MAG TPA: hypothetical protein DCE48_01910 [Lachnospiraceae bacterium]|nr:hypothetical protein [Lachnospiraceae bacterium]